jgi:hypothetical protein
VTLADANRRYPLSIAYIDLSVLRRTGLGGRLVTQSGAEAGHLFAESGGLRAEGVLGRSPRTLVVGQAGSGKTTLLQWLAVRAARGDFTGSLTSWNDTVPFFIPLRRYVNRSLPAPEEFPLAVGRNLAHEMPPGWVHGLLRAGRALVLVDGVDEMPEGQRDQVRAWLDDLTGSFRDARYVVTSRPTAIREGWLEGLEFAATELQPMSTADVTEFIHQWHQAVAAEILDPSEVADLTAYEQSLITALRAEPGTAHPAAPGPDGGLRGGAGNAARAAGPGSRRRTGRNTTDPHREDPAAAGHRVLAGPQRLVTSLEHISLGLFAAAPSDLGPLTGLPRLKTISLGGQSAFDVSSLAGIRGADITVPPGIKVVGADKLGPASRVTEHTGS